MKKSFLFLVTLIAFVGCGPLDENEQEEPLNNEVGSEEDINEEYGADATAVSTRSSATTRGLGDIVIPPIIPNIFTPKVEVCDGYVGKKPCSIFYWSDLDLSDNKWNNGRSIDNSISSIHVYPNQKILACLEKNLRGDCWTYNPNSTPTEWWRTANFDNRISSIESLKQVQSTNYKIKYKRKDPNYDSNWGDINTEKGIQGIANSDNHWYISNVRTIWKSKSENIKDEVIATHLDQNTKNFGTNNYNHIGDIDFYDGSLYAAIDGKNGVKALLAVFDENLRYKTHAFFPRNKQSTAGWVAINPVNGLIYSASSHPDDNKYRNFTTIHVYENNVRKGSDLIWKKDIKLNFATPKSNDKFWNDVYDQGAAFDKDGIFYYVVDHASDRNSEYTGVHAFKIDGNVGNELREHFINIKYNPDPSDEFGRGDELEGITFWDRTDSKKFTQDRYPGNIHVLKMYNNDIFDDQITLYHYEAVKEKGSIRNYKKGIKLFSHKTSSGKGGVHCPSNYVALGGGSWCSDGDFNVSHPVKDGYGTPIGWSSWHRGNTSNDCHVYATCAPKSWFNNGDIKVVSQNTGEGKGSVSCPSGYKAISGGSLCSDGDFDTAYPMSDLSGWKEHHRGDSSNDCRVYSVCVRKTNWVAKNTSLKSNKTGYGKGSVSCGSNQAAIGGGAWCSDGDFDVNYPGGDLKSWKEHHRGDSSKDCRVYATCLTL